MFKKGTNILYFGDFHLTNKPPSTRIDDYWTTEKNKIKQILKIAKEYDCKAIIQSGDFLDRPKLPEEFLKEVLQEFEYIPENELRSLLDSGKITEKEYTEKLLSNIPLIGTVGNHELYAGSLNSYNKTSLSFLEKVGFMSIVDKEKTYTILDNNNKIVISGIPYNHKNIKDKKNFILEQKQGDVDIFLVHDSFYNKPFKDFEIDWCSISDVSKDTKADITIAGHIHNGFGWEEQNGKIFGNPGVIAQQNSNDSELNRPIVVSIINIAPDKKITIKDIELNTPRSKDLFDLDVKNIKYSETEQLKKIEEILSSTPKVSSSKAEDIITELANNQEIDESVLNKALDKTIEVKNEFRDIPLCDPSVNYNVKKIILENFESHLITELNLNDEECTVVIGESSQGKSSIFRAVFWLLENEGDAKSFLRKAPGVDTVKVSLERSDGLVCTRIYSVEKKKNRKNDKIVQNGYIIKLPNGEIIETNTQGVKEVQDLFAFFKLQLSSKEQLPLNFRKQEDSRYFIGNSENARAKIIGALYGTQYIIEASRKLGLDKNYIDKEIKIVDKDISEFKEELTKYSDKEYEKKILEQLKVKNDYRLEQLKKKKDIETLLPKYNHTLLAKAKLSELIKEKPVIAKIQLDMSNLKNKKSQYRELQTTHNQLLTINSQVNKINSLLSNKELLNKIKLYYEKLNNNKNDNDILTKLLDKFNKLNSELNRLNKLLENKNILINVNTIKDKLKETQAKKDLILKTLELLDENKNQKNILCKKIKEYKEILDNLHKEKIMLTTDDYGNITIGNLTIYQVKIQGVENNKMELELVENKIKEYQEIFTKAETRLEFYNDQEITIRETFDNLGIKPEDAEKVLSELNKEQVELEEELNTSMKTLDDAIAKIKKEG